MFKRKSFLVAIILIGIFIVGCSSNISTDKNEGEVEGLKVAITLPNSLFPEIEPSTIEENLKVDKVEVNLYEGEGSNGEPIDNKVIDEIDQEITIAFGELSSGKVYTVEANLLGKIEGVEETRTLYKGVGSSDPIVAGAVTTIDLSVDPLRAKSLELIIESSSDIEEVILINPGSGQEIKRNYSQSILFEDGQNAVELWSSRWILRIIVKGEEYPIDKDILLLPTQEKRINLRLSYDEETGEIDGIVIVPTSPEAPNNLRLSQKEELIWDEVVGATVYSLYRSREDDLESRRYKGSVSTNLYPDPEDGYYYWVRAYNNNSSGKLSQSYLVQLDDEAVDGLVARWTFNDDCYGYESKVGDPEFLDVGPVEGAKVVRFDGSSSLVLGRGEELKPEALTVAFWVRRRGSMTGDGWSILMDASTGESQYGDGWSIGKWGSNQNLFILDGEDRIRWDYETDLNDLYSQSWTHLTFVFDSNEEIFKIYKDGVEKASFDDMFGFFRGSWDTASITAYETPLSLGALANGSLGVPLDFSDIRIYNTALDSEGVGELFDLGKDNEEITRSNLIVRVKDERGEELNSRVTIYRGEEAVDMAEGSTLQFRLDNGDYYVEVEKEGYEKKGLEIDLREDKEVFVELIKEEEEDEQGYEIISYELNDSNKRIRLDNYGPNENAFIVLFPRVISTDHYSIGNIRTSTTSTSNLGDNYIEQLERLTLVSDDEDRKRWLGEKVEIMKGLEEIPFSDNGYDDWSEDIGIQSQYSIGDQEDFHNITNENKPIYRATLRGDGDNSLLWIDNDISWSQSSIDWFIDTFEEQVCRQVIEVFGEMPSPDRFPVLEKHGPKVNMIFSPNVGPAGYFWSGDLFPGGVSNERRIIYQHSTGNPSHRNNLMGVVAHEFQHLLFANSYTGWHDSAWINEGYSELARDIAGFGHEQGIMPISGGYIRDTSNLSLITNGYTGFSFFNYEGAYLFARYIFDRFGQGVIDEVKESSNHPRHSIAEYAGYQFDQIFSDWALTLLFDGIDKGNRVEGRHRYSSINLPRPVSINQMGSNSTLDSIRAVGWGINYIQIGSGNGSDLEISLDNIDNDANYYATIVRWKE